MVANRVNNRFEETLPIKVSLIEHPALRQTIVNWHRALALRPAPRRESKEYFHVFLLALFLDRLFQFLHMCPCIRDCKDHPIVRHVLQGDLDSWEVIEMIISHICCHHDYASLGHPLQVANQRLTEKQARKLGRCDSYLQSETINHSLTH